MAARMVSILRPGSGGLSKVVFDPNKSAEDYLDDVGIDSDDASISVDGQPSNGDGSPEVRPGSIIAAGPRQLKAGN